MTTELDALAAKGVLHHASPPDGTEPCAASNVDTAALEAYARKAIGAFVPRLASQELVPNQLSLFDFSERKQSNRAALLAERRTFGAGGDPHRPPVLVTRVGDALQEPFWPEGLGEGRAWGRGWGWSRLI